MSEEVRRKIGELPGDFLLARIRDRFALPKWTRADELHRAGSSAFQLRADWNAAANYLQTFTRPRPR